MVVGSFLKANLGPCWLLKPMRNRPRRPQTALSGQSFDFRRHDRILAPFGLDFGRFWVPKGRQDLQKDPKLSPRPPKLSYILESIFKAFLRS